MSRIKSHYLFFVRRSEPRLRSASRAITLSISVFKAITYLCFNIQSHYLSSIWRSEPHSQFDTQSPHVYLSLDPSPFSSILAFRAIRHTSSGLFESFLFFIFGVQSHWAYFFRPFWVISFLSFGVQSHCTYPFRYFESPFSFLLLTFRVIPPYPYHSESQSLAFTSTSITHLIFRVLHSPSFSSPRHPILIVYSSLLS